MRSESQPQTVFADIHIHALYGVDDGAESLEEMIAIVNRAYAAGTRLLCLTPHFHPGYYGDNRRRAADAFTELSKISTERFPDLKLALGNELHYHKTAPTWVSDGSCKTLGSSDFLLVDFSFHEKKDVITEALYRLLNTGCKPILAHVELYKSLHGKYRELDALRNAGVFFQADCDSLLGASGFGVKRFLTGLLKRDMIDVFASDAHGAERRPWRMDECYQRLMKDFGKNYADRLCCKNGWQFVKTDTEV